ncbi:MAG: hypothetical protein JSW06_01100 [Thermoplasmatales archaeon]|nr:MAG: hypothetical protein JSW06_01100 [Thermoplasmatales archaeon]
MLVKVGKLITIGEYPNRFKVIRDNVRRMLDRKSGTSDVLNVSEKTLQRFIKITCKE